MELIETLGKLVTQQQTIIPHSALGFSGSGGMSWGVEPADLKECRLLEMGPLCILFFAIENSSVSGTPDTALLLTLPSYVPAAVAYGTTTMFGQGNVRFGGTPGNVNGDVSTHAGLRVLAFRLPGGGNFPTFLNATNLTGFAVWIKG
jgi:hypothetical protein